MEIKKRSAQVKIAAAFRGYSGRKLYAKRKKALISFQANVRRVLVKNELKRRFDAASKIQAACKGFLARRNLEKSEKFVKVKALARGFIVRQKFKPLMESRKPFKALLREGEIVVMKSAGMLEASAKRKRRNTALMIPHRLIFTSGPVPRILFVNQKTFKIKAEIEWDSNVTSALACNENTLLIYSNPGGNNMRRFWSFVFPEKVAAMWLLALQNPYTISDVLRLRRPPKNDKDIMNHGGMLPLKTDTGYIFGGPTVLGGLDQVYHYSEADLTQLSGWRPRYFVLKGTVLYWFKSIEDKYPIGGLSLNGNCSVSLGRAANKKIYNKAHKARQSLEIESPLLRNAIRINCESEKARQRFMGKVTKAINRRKEFHKRHSVSQGVKVNKPFVLTQELLEAMDVEDEERDEDDDKEDIEQPHLDILIP